MVVKSILHSHGIILHYLSVISGPAILGFTLERFGIPLPMAIGASVGIQISLILTFGIGTTNRG